MPKFEANLHKVSFDDVVEYRRGALRQICHTPRNSKLNFAKVALEVDSQVEGNGRCSDSAFNFSGEHLVTDQISLYGDSINAKRTFQCKFQCALHFVEVRVKRNCFLPDLGV